MITKLTKELSIFAFLYYCLAAVLPIINSAYADDSLAVCATVPELGSLVREVGGDEVSVSVFAKGTEDAHFVQAKPSFIKLLNKADLLVLNGLDLEVGWLPAIIKGARNSEVLLGGRGYLDASTVIVPLQVPTASVDRTMGDVHPLGNPHYLLDPLNGLRVARVVAEKLSELRPERESYFMQRYAQFRKKLAAAMVGDYLAERYEIEKLASLAEEGALKKFLSTQGELDKLDGWLGKLMPYYGAKVVGDHSMWPYLAARYGLDVRGYLEPLPGFPPTMKHLKTLIERMKVEDIKVILANAYYDPKHANFVAEKTGARVARMAHQVQSRPSTDDYLSMNDYNTRQLFIALSER